MYSAPLSLLPIVVAGRDAWQNNETIRWAINIDRGVIQNTSILSFQKRETDYPYAYIDLVAVAAPDKHVV
jgi:N5-(carboxyethyl)ornithine synthase